MPVIGAIMGSLPILIVLIVLVASVVGGRRKQQQASRVDWHRILDEITQTDGESFPQEDSVVEDDGNAGAEAIRAWAKATDPIASHAELASQIKMETAYEEEGMGRHTPQGGEERHATRPAWMDTPVAGTGEDSGRFRRMREAVILSEIIRPPLSKRRRERI
jgi:hypothetical protein